MGVGGSIDGSAKTARVEPVSQATSSLLTPGLSTCRPGREKMRLPQKSGTLFEKWKTGLVMSSFLVACSLLVCGLAHGLTFPRRCHSRYCYSTAVPTLRLSGRCHEVEENPWLSPSFSAVCHATKELPANENQFSMSIGVELLRGSFSVEL